MEFINYLIANAIKCTEHAEVIIQSRLLFNLFHGLMTREEMANRPLAAQAMTQAERLDFEDLFERKRILLYAKSKVAKIFPTLGLDDFLNLPLQYMDFIVRVASKVDQESSQAENEQATQLMKNMGLLASRNHQSDKL